MSKLTGNQIEEMKSNIQNTVDDLNVKLDDEDLTDEEFDEIDRSIRNLLNAKSKLNAQAIRGTAEEIQQSVQGIRGATNNAQLALRRIGRAKGIIQIASSLASLGTAIASGNPTAIFKAVGGVASVVNRI